MSLIPELFDVAPFERPPETSVPAVDTPLGRFSLSARVEPPIPADAVHLRARGGELFLWDGPAARLELRLSKPDLHLPDGMTVSDARAAVWRIRARRQLFKVELSCELGGVLRNPAPETGQGLESLVWEANGVRLSLGAPDAEALLHFAGDGAPFPQSWITAWGDTGTIPRVDYSARGFRAVLPGLLPTELAQTHFVVAWAPADAHPGATWFAVDQSPRTLLRHRESAV